MIPVRSLSAVAITVASLVLGNRPSVGFAQPTETAAVPSSPPARTSTASTDPNAAREAGRHADAGKAFYKERKYPEALSEFEKAYGLLPTAALTYNMARCHERLSHWQEAIDLYANYVREVTDARDKADGLEKIEFLKPRLAPDASSPEVMYQSRIEAGRKLFNRGDYEGAIEEFRAAFDIKTTPAPLYNLGKSYEKLNRYEDAIDHYTQYLALDPKATDRGDVEETVRRLRKSIKERFQELAVRSDPPGAEIYLDQRNTGLQGQTDFTFKLKPGPHTLFLDLNGYEPVKREFTMPDDKPLVLEFALKKLRDVGHITVKVSKDGARIFIDGAIVGLSPYTQKKALTAGSHQIQVEAVGYIRHTQTFEVVRDKTSEVDVALEEYEAPVLDETLSRWGRNLLLIGVVGGSLGFFGPLAYQELIFRRDPYTQLGPREISRTSFYAGPLADDDANLRQDPTHRTLSDIQLWSIIGGSVFSAAGLGFYIYKWVRTVPAGQPVTARVDRVPGDPEADPISSVPRIRIESVSIAATPGGTSLGFSGSF